MARSEVARALDPRNMTQSSPGVRPFRIVASVQLRLVPKTKVERVLEVRTVDDLAGSKTVMIEKGRNGFWNRRKCFKMKVVPTVRV
jgi:hypothetical protein